MLKVVLAAGGTGGHILPAVSVAGEIKNREAEAKIIFIVEKKQRVDAAIDPAWEVIELPAVGMPRRFSPRMLGFGYKMAISIVKSYRALRRIRPHAVVGFGGYLSVGPVLAARLCRVPVFLHEANLVLGRANRLLSKYAAKLMFNHRPEAFAGNNCVEVGMPLRSEFSTPGNRAESRTKLGLDPDRRTIVIMGGSQGAHRINAAAVEMLKKYREQLKDFQFIHLTGEADYRWVLQQYETLQFKAYVRSFEPAMKQVLDAADVAVARAGASTLAELAATATPAVLIPYPFAVDDHQTANARYMERKGCARALEDGKLNGERLFQALEAILADECGLELMSSNARELSACDASKKMVNIIFNYIDFCKINFTGLY